MPFAPVETVASGAQLLTRADADSRLVEAVTEIVLDKNFARENDLKKLFESKDLEFAKARPEFPIHEGARSYYDPAFDIHLIESWEASYSLVVSILIGTFLGVGWVRRRKSRTTAHRLDRYMQSLLKIERHQVSLDRERRMEDAESLQELLDEVTELRQEALREFTAHELTEDRAANCFIRMCHALSHKINAKLSRQRLDMVMHSVIETIRERDSDREGESTSSD